jgi:hypothetical protein
MNSRRYLPLVIVLFASSLAHAQDFPRVELYTGYSYLHAAFNGVPGKKSTLNGWDASLAINPKRWFGVVVGYSQHYGSAKVLLPLPPGICPPACLPDIPVSSTTREFLVGPQFSLRTSRVTPFVHFLLDFRSTDLKLKLPLPLPPQNLGLHGTYTLLDSLVGGGVDIRLSRQLAWRTQADLLTTESATERDLRMSTGIVFRWGE